MASVPPPDAPDAGPETAASAPPRSTAQSTARRWLKRLGWVLALLLAPLLLAAAFFASPIGKRVIADQIAAVAPASGLRFTVGRIEGDLYRTARLYDVVVSDPKGEFLTLPEVTLDWRPLAWLWRGLDIRKVETRRGRLMRLPELLPGDPDAPLLPDFDIRVDRLAVRDLVIAPGVATPAAERAQLTARIDIRQGRALVQAQARLGAQDRLALLLDAEPDGNRFDLAADALAPAGGVIAGLAGLKAGYTLRIAGDGTWARWRGTALARQITAPGQPAPPPLAALTIGNAAGRYSVLGRVRPPLAAESLASAALGPDGAAVAAVFTLDESVIEGRSAVVTPALDLRLAGVADLAANRVEGARLRLALRDPALLGPAVRLEGASLRADLKGAFRDLAITHRLEVQRLAASGIEARGLAQQATARVTGERITLPLALTAARIVTGQAALDPRLAAGRVSGTVVYDLAAGTVAADRTRITFPGLEASLALRGDVGAGAYAIAGPVSARGLRLDNLGTLTANAKVLAKFGPKVPWQLNANLAATLTRISNETLVTLAGERIALRGSLGLGEGRPIVLRDGVIASPRLNARLDSRVVTGTGGLRTTLAGSGRQAQYGPFRFNAEIAADGPRAELVLADPYPAAGLKDVRLALAPAPDGFALAVAGGSLLGPFEVALGIVLPQRGPTRIAIERLTVSRTRITGAVALGDDGPAGELALSGGGISGAASFGPAGGEAVAFAATLTARGAAFGGENALAITKADLTARGEFGGAATRINADLAASGVAYGTARLASLAARAAIVDGRGTVTGSLAGERRDRFALAFDAEVAPDRIAAAARGQYGGERLTMPRRAVLTAQGDGGWRLAPTQLGFGGGYAILSGTLGNGETALEAKVANMPLRLIDLTGAQLGLGGKLSGVLDYRQTGTAPPLATARIRVDRFTRAGLVLSSKPVDVLGVAALSETRFTAAGRLLEGGARRGDVALAIDGLEPDNDLARRLTSGALDARLVYDGPAETLWRLAAIELFDLAGPLRLAARATGTLADPRIGGTLATDGMTVSSALTGTRVERISARGTFAGSRLELTRFSGTPRGGGGISGSGTIDLAKVSAERGPRLDLRAAMRNAPLLDANGLRATLTGPLRIVSDGVGGTIAGRVTIERASWQLGTAAEEVALPAIATREINAATGRERAQASGRDASWRYLVNATAPSRVAVRGLGLESEWGIDIALRGTVDNPRIGGAAQLVRGDYTFAGTRFELTRGRIQFDPNGPIDPRLDILAETARNGTNVDIAITGNALLPEIAFSSDPPLPDEEILARLLFGGSVTSLSATDALQLAAAVAALQGGEGGLDPIGELRRSIGLDQLRVVGADPLIGRGTGVAIGKNLGRSVFVELITDGRGYNATQVEYRITSWLALLGTVSTIGRDSILMQVRRDY